MPTAPPLHYTLLPLHKVHKWNGIKKLLQKGEMNGTPTPFCRTFICPLLGLNYYRKRRFGGLGHEARLVLAHDLNGLCQFDTGFRNLQAVLGADSLGNIGLGNRFKQSALFRCAEGKRNRLALERFYFLIERVLLFSFGGVELGFFGLHLFYLVLGRGYRVLVRQKEVDRVALGHLDNHIGLPASAHVTQEYYLHIPKLYCHFYCVASHLSAASFWGSLPATTSSRVRAASMSALSPPSDMEEPLGVSHRATVTLSSAPSPSSISCWTEPLPKVRVPTSLATLCCCRAPAKISDADAEPWSTSIAIFIFLPAKTL